MPFKSLVVIGYSFGARAHVCFSVLLTCRAVVRSFASEEQERFARDGSLLLFVTLDLTFFSHTINISNDQTLILDIYWKKKKNSLPSMLRQVKNLPPLFHNVSAPVKLKRLSCFFFAC